MSYNLMGKQTCQWVSENEHDAFFLFTSLILFNIFLFKACDVQSKEEEDIAELWAKFCLFAHMNFFNNLTPKTVV